MAGSTNHFATHTPPLAFTPDAESSPSNTPSQHDFVQIAPSTVSLASSSTTTATTLNHGPHSMLLGQGAGGPISAAVFGGPPAFGQPAIGQPLPQIPGATVYTPTATPGAELNPRSCVTCRRRKVRCDKHMPCSNCRRALIPCIFPAPERAPRRPRRKDPSALRPHQSTEREIELLKRLRKLEGIVEELSGQVELEATKHSSNGGSPEAAHMPSGSGGGGSISVGMHSHLAMSASMDTLNNQLIGPIPSAPPVMAASAPGSVAGTVMAPGNSSPGRLMSNEKPTRVGKDTERQFGRLVINDYGRSRYVSSAFWSKISDELDELRAEAQRISEPETDASETESSPPHDTDEHSETDHHAFVFGFQSSAVDLRPLHPLPSQIPYMWQVYLENVDPVVKVLHTPTTSKLIRNARTNLDDISPAAEALMFAIYYAAVSSLDEKEIKINFMAEKESLVNKYRFALEQALTKAQFLVSSDMVVLQAFVLYVVLIRRNDETRLAWTMTGLAIRIGHSIGLHRDGSNFARLKPFEIEMRRRLFWALCIIDMRSAEDLGTELSILEHGFDVQLPLNINDSDIGPESMVLPPARQGATDMTFALIRYEILSVARRMHMHAGGFPEEGNPTLLGERAQMIHEVYEHVQHKYLSTGDAKTDPIFWVAGTMARVICAKMTLMTYQPVLLPTGNGDDNEDLSGDLRDRLFTASTELFEYSHTLTMDPRTKQYRWLFKTYIQWHAVAYLLVEEARRPWSASVERSWQALSSIISGPKSSHEMEKMSDNASIWMPFKMLYSKARRHREAELQRLQANRAEIIRLDREDRVRLAPTIFTANEDGIDGYQWRDRWLELVGAADLSGESPQAESSGAVSTAGSEVGDDAGKAAELAELDDPSAKSEAAHADQSNGNGHADMLSGPAQRDNILDHVFSQPTFEATDLYHAYFDDELNKNLPEASVFGAFANTDMPRQDPSLASFAIRGALAGDPGHASATAIHDPSAGSHVGDAQLLDGIAKDYPPPWMWTDATQVPAPAPVPGLLDDGDIKMDDHFDWQDFGQNLGGMPNGVWSAHGL